jgi:hypothetical protein
MADAFGALLGIDDVALFAGADGLVRAVGFAGAAVDALFGNDESHGIPPWSIRGYYIPSGKIGNVRAYFRISSLPALREAS